MCVDGFRGENQMIGLTTAICLAAALADPGDGSSANTIEVATVLIKLIEQVDVAAQEAGLLVEVGVREGAEVEKDELLARIDAKAAALAEKKAKLEWDIARERSKNDVNVRFAKKSAEVAQAELDRAEESNKIFPKSISDTEMDRLRLTVQKTELEVEQATHEQKIADQTALVKESDYEIAANQVQRRQILSPLEGVVVQVHRRPGEWVEPGDHVLRILRVDPLKAEGFFKVDDLQYDLQDRPVKLRVKLRGNQYAVFPGKVVFISPEIDPVNAQVRFWAEVDNSQRKLRPGMRADLSIDLNAEPVDDAEQADE
jgi:macrolide-specific efflux system membrane fusion protein